MDKYITILGKPEGKQRPRVTQRGGFARTYTPSETITYENLIKVEYKAQCNEFYDKDKQIKLTLNAYVDIPKSVSKKQYSNYLNNVVRPVKKPDVDNIAKVFMDALNGIAYADDCQVIELCVAKLYGDRPRVEFKLEVLNA